MLRKRRDENPSTVAFVRETILAYLHTALNSENHAWEDLQTAIKNDSNAKGSIECK